MDDGQFKPGITSLASGLFCWFADVIIYPIDTVSTRLKGSKQKPNVSTIRYVLDSFRKEGRGLYRGVSLTLPHSFIPTVIYVYIYENLIRKTSSIVDSYSIRNEWKLLFPFFVSSIAAAIALVLQLPFDTVRARIQMNTDYQYSSVLKGLREIKEKEGVLRFYKSTKIYFATRTLYTGVQFQTYQMLNYYYGHLQYSLVPISVLSAIVATTVLNPLEVIITRYALVDTTKKKLLFSYMVQRIFKREGIAGFYKGFGVQLFTHGFFSLLWLPVFQFMRQKYGVKLAE